METKESFRADARLRDLMEQENVRIFDYVGRLLEGGCVGY